MDVLNLYEDPYIANMLSCDNMKEQLERKYWGKWVVIANLELFGVYDSMDEAELAAKSAKSQLRDHFTTKVGDRSTVVLPNGGLGNSPRS